METQTQIDTRDAIMDKMKSEGRSLAWLANRMGVNYNTLYSILIHKVINLSDENRSNINSVLGTKFK